MDTIAEVYEQDYRDHKITFRPDNFRFEVSGPEFTHKSASDRLFDSAENAREEITKRAEETAKISMRSLNLNLPVIREDGSLARITTVNRQNSRLAGFDGCVHVYPDVPWLRDAIRRIAELENLKEAIKPYRIKVLQGWQEGRLTALSAEKIANELPKEHAELTRKAQEMATPQEIQTA
jgi:hypothetical protein